MLVCQLVLSVITTIVRTVIAIVRTITETVCGWVKTVITTIVEVAKKVCKWLPWLINKLCEWVTELSATGFCQGQGEVCLSNPTISCAPSSTCADPTIESNHLILLTHE